MINFIFGEKIDNVNYRLWFGVYVIILNLIYDKIILV